MQHLGNVDVVTTIEHLLEFEALPNSAYEMFPVGSSCAIGRFSVLCLAGKSEKIVDLLLGKDADPHRRNLLNYFPSGSPLWTAAP